MSTTITVTWQSANSGSGNTVRYGLQPELYNYSKEGSAFSGGSGFMHNVELTDLSPDTVYYFVCGGITGGWSTERKFRTAPTHPQYVKFVAGSDSRTDTYTRDQVSEAMRTFNPSFVLMGGDLVDDGYVQSEWDNFFDSVNSLWIDSNNFTIPIIPCLGNHEYNALKYYQQFALPGNEQWFSLNWGDLLHIIVLNSETTVTGSQLAWLQQDLEAHKDYLWKIAMFHQPAYTASRHAPRSDIVSAWCPLFDQYHVQVVVAGHNHCYERSKPIYKGAVVSEYSLGTMYVTAGSWGAPLYGVGSAAWLAYANSIYHFTVIEAYNNGTLSFGAYNTQGQIFDSATLETTVLLEFSYFAVLFIVLATIAALLWIGIRKKRYLQSSVD